MNAPLRRVGVVVLVLFSMLYLNLNWVQAYRADEYRNSDYNGRVLITEYERPRGKIVNAQGVALADSKETTGEYKYLRVYPFGEQYAHVLGYKPLTLASTDLEKLENDFLAGTADEQTAERIEAMFTGEKNPGGNVLLTLSKATQEAAFNELKANKRGAVRGAVVALDPSNGALLAAVSMPSYDPNPLVVHDTNKASAAYNALDKNENKPLRNRAFSETFPPGSTFKVVTAAAAMNKLNMNPSTVIQGGDSYQPPQTSSFVIRNSTGVVCPDSITLKQALTVSCNTAFARLGVDQIGDASLKAMARDFGFESEPRFDRDDRTNYMGVAASRTGSMSTQDGRVDPPALAQSSIGQREVRMTPLQGAMIAATVANDGSLMRPYLVDKLQLADLTVISPTEPKQIRRPFSGQVASGLQEMMVSVVQSGTGRNARINGFDVGGKTGTAENAEDALDHGWFIGFARKGGKGHIAVAVFLENAGRGGSAEAARIAGLVMRAYIGEKGL
jgi:peptidoglycan glycosyltransferase